ncbi:MAG: class I SAM-dependent methyltransferase [Candidatus Poribacteria bacterium]|nr:class I SAM-dependent methyltransferase [Candidatus Poribacteria bacterium]
MSEKRDEWASTPLAWDTERLSRTPQTVSCNWSRMTDRMRALVRELGRGRADVCLLDLGCGKGGFDDGLKDSRTLYIGIDPAIEMLRQATPSVGATHLCGIGETIPLKDASVDILILKSVLMHCYDPPEVLREARRVLRVGGRCIVSVSNGGAWFGWMRSLARRRRQGSDGHLHVFDPESLRLLLETAAFHVESVKTLGFLIAPGLLDRRFPRSWVNAACGAADVIGGAICPSMGGTLMIVAEPTELR